MKRLLLNIFWVLFVFSIQAKVISAKSTNQELRSTIDLAWKLSNRNADSAMIVINEAMQMSITDNDKAELLRLKGLIYFYKVDYVKALNYFIKSKDLYQKTGNKEGEASALSNVSLVYGKQGLRQKALNMELEALEMRKQIGDSSKIAASLNNLAVAYQNIGQLKKALNLYKEALSILNSIHEVEATDLYNNNIGHIYMILNKSDSAIQYFNTSLAIGQRLNDKQIISNSLVYIGDYYLEKHNYTKAIKYLKESLVLAKEIGIVYEIEDASDKLHTAYAKNGNYKEAYNMLQLSKAMADSANNLKAMQKITEIETSLTYKKEMELQKLEQEKTELQNKLTLHKHKQIRNIAIIIVFGSLIWIFFLFRSYQREHKLNHELIEQKEEIETQRDKIEELNNTKDKFFALIAHDLKNPLIAISNLAEIMKLDFGSFNKDKLKGYISMIHNSTQKAYELLENLLHWAMMQSGNIKDHPVEFNLVDSIVKSIELLMQNSEQKGLKVSLTGYGNYMAYADKEMITTVLRNLLNNAIKFSSKDGNIVFSINKENEFWRISIKDDGIGIALQDQKVLFDLKKNNNNIGTSKEKGTGLGLVLCKDFVELNGGKIWVESEINKGSTFHFTVPATS